MTDELSVAIIEAVADEKGVDLRELDFTLQDHIDVDAIKTLVSHDAVSWRLSFELPDHEIVVTGDGTIVVDGNNPSTPT